MYCKAKEVLIEGPAGTGKTRATLEKIFILCEKYANLRIAICRRTRESMSETVLATWEEKVVPAGHVCIRGARSDTIQRQKRSIYAFPNGSRIVIGGLDKPSRIMSSDYDVIYVAEATEITEDAWEYLLTRLRNHKLPYQQGIADCNPDVPGHWLNRRADTDKMTRLASRHGDNLSVTEDYLLILDGLTGVRRKRLKDGLWAAAEGVVYDEWDQTVHIVPFIPDITDDRGKPTRKPPDHWRIVAGVDFGFSNPFCFLWATINPITQQIVVFRELYHTKRIIEDHAETVKKLSRGERIELAACDWSPGERLTLDRAGIPTVRAYKDKTAGIEAVRARLRTQAYGQPGIVFLTDILHEMDHSLDERKLPVSVVQEVPGYAYKDYNPSKPVQEEPIDRDNHGCDAVRYLVCYVDEVEKGSLGGRILGAPPSEQDQLVSLRKDVTVISNPPPPQQRDHIPGHSIWDENKWSTIWTQ